MPPLGKDKIEQLIRAFFSDLLSQADEHALLFPQDDTIDLKAESEALETNLSGIRAQIASHNYDGVTKADAEDLLAPLGGKRTGRSEEDFDAICNGILRAKLEQHRILAAMLRGEYQNTVPIDPLFNGVKSPGLPPLPGEDAASAKQSASKAVEKFIALKTKFDWTEHTRVENKRALDWFIDFVGQDRKVSTITKDDVKDFRDALLSVPASFSQSKKFKGMSFKEAAAAGTDGKTLSAGTVVKYFGAVKGFFSWCEEDGYATFNPASKIKMPVKGNPIDDHDSFSPEQLQLIFHSPIFTGCMSASRRKISGDFIIQDGEYWVPLIGLLTGMRLGEIIQMRVTDIKEQDGVQYFNVTDEASFQSLKTKSSKRVIPIHRDLIRFGFLKYISDKQSTHPDHRVFDEIKPSATGSFSANFSRTFSRYIKSIGAKTKKTSFHSFRHNFTDFVRIAGVDEIRQNALLGHANQSVGSHYGSKFTAHMLKNDVDKVNPPIDLTGC